MRICVVILSLFIAITCSFAENELDSLYKQLEETMLNRSKYEALKENKLNGLKMLREENSLNADRLFYINNKILEEYIPYNFDSAIHYIDLNLELAKKYNDLSFKHETNIHLANLLAFSGRYLESLDVVKTVDSNDLSLALKQEYWGIYVKVYSELVMSTPSIVSQNLYEELYDSYSDSLLRILDSNSEGYLAIQEKKYRDTRMLIDCKRINTQRMALATMGTRIYSTIAFERAILYELENQTELEKKYLILSSISDIKAAVKDNASLTKLAMVLYEEEKIDIAYRYIMFSFEDAAFYNSKLRFIQISSILPLISETYQLKTDRQKAELSRYLFIISILSGVLMLAILAIYKQIKSLRVAKAELIMANERLQELNFNLKKTNTKLNEVNNELVESDHVKEHYIGSFLAICSEYIDKLDAFRKMVNKNIVAHKIDDLFALTKSRKLIDDEIADFYNNFDNIFLHIFPNFIEKINALLIDEGQLETKKGELLSTELRIYALIRLGISDSSKIAHLLRYSVNTIYNYRVRVKNNASISRDDFESAVMKIGTKIN